MVLNPALASIKRRSFVAAGIFTAAAIALTGCVSAVDQADDPTVAPERGGTLTVAVTPDADPGAILGGYTSNWPWILNVFEPLISLDPETFEPQPVLASEWEVAEDGLSMDLTLEEGVTFHSGRELTAEDVKYSFETAADPVTASQVGFIARQFESIEVTSPTSLTINFSAPLSNIYDFLDQTVIVDQETYANLGDGSEVIGTGPYEFVDWTPGASYTLERYEDYRDEDVANIDSIEYAVILDATAELSALRSGRAQVAFGLSTNDVQEFADNDQYSVVNTGGTIYPFGMNTTIAPFDNAEVRQALFYAVDSERINDQIMQGTGTITDLFWSPNTPGYSKELAETYTYDPELATQMIEDAGATGTEVPIVFMQTPVMSSVFEIVANNLAAVGLEATAVPLDSPTFIARQVAGDLGPVFLGTHGQIGRGPATLLDSLPTLREGNPSQFWTDEYADLRQAVKTASRDDSAQALEALSAYMVEQAFVLPILQAPRQVVISNGVEGLEIGLFSELIAHNAYVAQ